MRKIGYLRFLLFWVFLLCVFMFEDFLLQLFLYSKEINSKLSKNIKGSPQVPNPRLSRVTKYQHPFLRSHVQLQVVIIVYSFRRGKS